MPAGAMGTKSLLMTLFIHSPHTQPQSWCSICFHALPLKNAKEFHQSLKSIAVEEIGAKALDAHTLELTLENPVPYFLELLNHFSWFPVHRPTIEKFDAYENWVGMDQTQEFHWKWAFSAKKHHINSVIEG